MSERSELVSDDLFGERGELNDFELLDVDPELVVHEEHRLSRRRLLKAAGGAAAMAAAGPALLRSGKASAALTKEEASIGAQLRALLGTPKNIIKSGPGTFTLPQLLPLSGQGAIYGKIQGEGLRYGAKHVAAWTNGKLNFKIEALDHKSADPKASAAVARKVGLEHRGVSVASYIFGFGAMVPALKQYKTFTFDPGGGTGPILKGVPYCYGFRASWPDDCQDGLWQVIKHFHPNAKKWVAVSPDLGAAWNNPLKTTLDGIASRLGINLTFMTAPYGATDYSQTVQAMKAANADVYVTLWFGTDAQFGTRELARQGMLGKAIFSTAEFTYDNVAAVGDLWKDWYFGYDYLDAVHPPSDFSKLFVSNFKKDHGGEQPQNYHAADYSTAFGVAILIDRILGAKANLRKGDDYVKAINKNNVFPHVYGGHGKTIGKLIMDLKLHTPSSLPLIAFQSKGTKNPLDIKQLATYNVRGKDVTYL
jgi:hypothetical protein